MKILHVLQSSSYSGAENVVIQIIKMFSSNDNVQSVYASTKGEIEKVLKDNNIDYMLMNKFNYTNLKKIIKEYNPDIIHAHDFQASILCSLLKKDKIVISHIHSNPEWIKKVNIKTIAYLIASHKINKILTVSPKISKNYIFRDRIVDKVIEIGNPVNSDDIRKRANEDLMVNDREKCDVIFVGRLEDVKNPFKFIDIISKVKKSIIEVKAFMVGFGSLYEECQEYIEKLELTNNIKLLGFQENPYTIIKNSKLLCITSKNEGYSLVALEAISLSKPVVSVNVGEVSSIIDSSSGLVSDDEDKIVSEIIKLITDETYRENKSNASTIRSIELNNSVKFKEVLYSLYNNSRL